MKTGFIQKILIIVALFIGFFILPAPTAVGAGSVLINEIAWMGTNASQYAEWIELYNTTGDSIDFSGWTIFKTSTTTADIKLISLSGAINPHGYFLIERVTTSSPDATDVVADVSGSFGDSGLNNTGENLALKDAQSILIDSVSTIDGKWQAGINDTKNKIKSTMERKMDGGWQTNDGITINGHDAAGNPINGTPRAVNSAGLSSTSTTTPQTESSTAPSGGSSGPSSSAEEKILTAEAGPDIFIERGKPIALNGLSSVGADSYKWYLGDGATKDGAEITYTYQFPGTYVVTLEVGSGEKIKTDQLRVFVFGGKAVINEFFIGNSSTTGQWIEVYNPNKESLDLSGWILSSGSKNFIVPAFVIIPEGGYLVFSQQITGLDISSFNKISVKYPTGLATDEVSLDKNMADYSANRSGDGFFWSKEITPGKQNIVLPSGSKISDIPAAVTNRVVLKSDDGAKNYIASFYSSVENQKEDAVGASVVEVSGGFIQKLLSSIIFWVITIIIFGIFLSIFYFKLTNKKNAYNNKIN